MSGTDPQAELLAMPTEHDFLIGIDSDGCAFDTMEPKHKECFCPAMVWKMELASVSKAAREVWEFVNLYGKTRGCNRFLALQYAMDWLRKRSDVAARGVHVPELPSLVAWTAVEGKLGNDALEAYVADHPDNHEMARVLDWSVTVNDLVAKIVKGVPPFPGVVESLDEVSKRADVVVVSATPNEALQREWAEHGIERYVRAICGQEVGKKDQCLALADNGRYQANKVLMIGDAQGDLAAARKAGALFYPINPGGEAASWKRFHDEVAERFFAGTYAGAYEQSLIDEFDACLPENPPW